MADGFWPGFWFGVGWIILVVVMFAGLLRVLAYTRRPNDG